MNILKSTCMITSDKRADITGFMQDLPDNPTIQEVNAMKLAQAKEYLGENYLLHPVNAIRRKEAA